MLGEMLKLVRLYHRFDQKTAAKKLELPASYLSEIERGKKNPTLRVLEKYEEVFDLPKSSLMYIAESLESKKTKNTLPKKALKILEWAAE